ncbi:UNVERIFIED_CONTAM: hypothetical protein HDU68_001963 [Siphonaria sp. JEL0065]|nr:hypothetical protein HDU68_001963 [Siphonaria sp. JEL0065]
MPVYRLLYLAANSDEAWKLDLKRVTFLDESAEQVEIVAFSCSGTEDGFDVAAVFEDNDDIWGGRADENERIWIQIESDSDVVDFSATAVDQLGAFLTLQRQNQDNNFEFEDLVRYKVDDDGELVQVSLDEGPGPSLDDMVTEPSQEGDLSVLPDICFYKNLQPDREEEFVPDPDFYVSVNCEGLWVCCSLAAADVLDVACEKVREWYKPELRELCSTFRCPKGSTGDDNGPMRIVILDHETNETSKDIPEFIGKPESEEKEGTRNGTSCPFIFSSRDDFQGGFSGWPEGNLTCHELFHGIDMVIRQQVDPAFHWKVEEAYKAHMARGTLGKVYATEHRDEYIAEMMTVYHGVQEQDLIDLGLTSREQLYEMAPEVYALIEEYVVAGDESEE